MMQFIKKTSRNNFRSLSVHIPKMCTDKPKMLNLVQKSDAYETFTTTI